MSARKRTRVDITAGEWCWTVAAVFTGGALFGWAATAMLKAVPGQSLGSIADCVAALGAIVAAGSTIAIAVIAQRSVAGKRKESLVLAKAVIKTAVGADMEKAVRVCRNWKVYKSDRLISVAKDLYLHEVPRDDASVSGLPAPVLRQFMKARGTLPLLKSAALSLSRTESVHRRKYLIFRLERFAQELKPVADYLSGSDLAPWKDWVPELDPVYFQNRILRYHPPRDTTAAS